MPLWLISIGQGIAKFFAWLWNFYWNRLTLKAKLALWAVIIILIVAGYILYLRHVRTQLQQELNETNINSSLRDDQRLANEEQKLKEDANKIAENTNALSTQRNSARDRDSSTRSGSQSAADDAYCPSHCKDSSCREWRQTHPCP